MGCCSNKDILVKKNLYPNYSPTPSAMLPYSYHYDLRKKFTFIRILNRGSFGIVKLFKDKTFENVLYAVKSIPKENLNSKKFSVIKKEIENLSNLDHPNIVVYYATIEDNNYFHIMMEYLSGPDIMGIFLHKRSEISHKSGKYILYQVLCALSYIHSQNIVHRDIKPENIICAVDNGKYDIKLIDFGLTDNVNDDCHERAGSPLYMAPEAINMKISPKSDVWSLGVMYYCYCYGVLPFDDPDENVLFNNILNKDINYSLPLLDNITDDDIDIVKKMLEKDEKKRISAFEALNHPVFVNISKELEYEPTEKYLNDFFSKKTLNLIKSYVKCNILKKTFLYLYTLLKPFETCSYYRKMFMALDNYFDSYKGYLKVKNILDEFIKRKLVEEEDYKIFTFIDCYNPNKGKEVLKENNIKSPKKKVRHSLIMETLEIDNWGIIEYTVFVSFFFINELSLQNKKSIEEKLMYGFQLFCNEDSFIEEGNNLSENSNNSINTFELDKIEKLKYFITKDSFKKYLYKHFFPYIDSEEDIDNFFEEYKNPINYREFQKLIISNEI